MPLTVLVAFFLIHSATGDASKCQWRAGLPAVLGARAGVSTLATVRTLLGEAPAQYRSESFDVGLCYSARTSSGVVYALFVASGFAGPDTVSNVVVSSVPDPWLRPELCTPVAAVPKACLESRCLGIGDSVGLADRVMGPATKQETDARQWSCEWSRGDDTVGEAGVRIEVVGKRITRTELFWEEESR